MSAAGTTVEYQWTNYQAHVRDTLEAGDVDLVALRTGYGRGEVPLRWAVDPSRRHCRHGGRR